MRILLTGGGTAGHIYPLLTIWEELETKIKDERLEVLYVGSRGGIEEEILKDMNIPSIFIYSGKWRRYWKIWPPALFLNFLDLFKIFIGFFQAFFTVVRFRPGVIMAKGGYVTLPVIFASWFCKIPLITHESDIILGLSNKISARFAKKICVSFPLEFYKSLPEEKMIETGNPVREEFMEAEGKSKKTKIRKKYPTILITGGSQGSQKINQIVGQILPSLLGISIVYHLTGPLGIERIEEIKNGLKKDLKKRYFVYDFLEKEMPEVMREADLVISRAGANTLAEIAASSKPSILIPLPTAASDHQTKNAEIFAQNGASILLKEDELTSSNLLLEIKKLLEDRGSLKEMGERAKRLSYPEAATKIVEEIIKERIL